MAKRTLLALSAWPCCLPVPGRRQPLGQSEKNLFLRSRRQPGRSRLNLERLDAQALPPDEKIELMKKLTELGDRYYQKNNDALAEAFYRKDAEHLPPGRLAAVQQAGKNLPAPRRHLLELRRHRPAIRAGDRAASPAPFLLLSGFFSVLMFSGLLLFFMVAAALVIRYFKLAAHDFILEGQSRFSLGKAPVAAAARALAPADHRRLGALPLPAVRFPLELFQPRRARQRQAHPGPAAGCWPSFYSLGQYLEKSMQSPGFQTIKQIYAGQLFPPKPINRFDNEMKVMQAYAYYHRDQPDAALDVLQATRQQLPPPLKFNLLGNIHYEKGNIPQSIQYYRQSLSLDDRNQATLKNFTVALLKNNDPELFLFYSKSYPQIKASKTRSPRCRKTAFRKISYGNAC